MWSLRNNNNYEQTGLLVSLSYFANNRRQFLENFYEKSKRSILKAQDRRSGGVRAAGERSAPRARRPSCCASCRSSPSRSRARPRRSSVDRAQRRASRATFPAGSYIIRMDQPYSRIADALLDYQYWSPAETITPYDDTGWTFPEGFGVQARRASSIAKVLDVPMETVSGDDPAPGGVVGTGALFAINNNADNELATLRYQLEGRRHPGGRGAVRRGRAPLQPRDVHRARACRGRRSTRSRRSSA